jgi:ferric-dicitrate binding protein FerR (iron transport regulator)
MNAIRFKILMDRYVAGEAGNDDWMELVEMIRTGAYDDLLRQFIDEIYQAEEGGEDISSGRREELLLKIYAMAPAPRRIMHIRWWAAASVTLLLLAGGLYIGSRKKAAPAPLVVKKEAAVKKDVLPGSDKAVLTLADGSTVTLDAAGNQVLRQGNTAIRQLNGQLQYESSAAGKEMSYNTLTTPRGGQYQLLLPDGTGVWLNAGSSLRYPVAFKGNERKVILTGEAYFEVTHNEKQPFRIQVGDQLVEDLGTHFNINAYADEPEMKTTLLEGSVKVGNVVLKPGEQALVNKQGDISVKKAINTADAIAWKSGFFVFKDANLKTVMREIARWYDVTVIYQPDVNNSQQFSGRIDRSLTLSQVLNGLALTKARFSMEKNRTVVILP